MWRAVEHLQQSFRRGPLLRLWGCSSWSGLMVAAFVCRRGACLVAPRTPGRAWAGRARAVSAAKFVVAFAAATTN